MDTADGNNLGVLSYLWMSAFIQFRYVSLDVDSADVVGRLTTTCCVPPIFISRQDSYVEVFVIT